MFSLILIGLNCSCDAIVFFRGETLSAYSPRPRKIPGWIVLVREMFSLTSGHLVGFFSGFVSFVTSCGFIVCFLPFTIRLLGLSSVSEWARRRKFSGEQ